MAFSNKPCFLLFTIFLSVLVFTANGQGSRRQQPETQTQRRLRDAQQCRLQRLSVSRPNRRIESEGGITELWDEFDDQFQCAGVAAMRNIIQPNSLSLPNFSPSPRLVYIQRGRGVLGISYPGCAETYHSPSAFRGGRSGQEQTGETIRDQHQKIHRIRQGDIVALPAGVSHWCYNDGNEGLVTLSVTDMNNEANQLDNRPRSFYLAGGQPRGQTTLQQTREQETRELRRDRPENLLRGFDSNLLAEAFNMDADLVRRMQREDERGYIVRAQAGTMSIIRPDEEEADERRYQRGEERDNGLEETVCNMRINQYLDNPREADVYSRQSGRLNSVNIHKLPILEYLDMSAEKGELFSNALVAPHWSMNAHNIIYVTRGEGQVQVVAHNGQTVMNERVRQGDLFVVPRYYAVMKQAENEGCEWVNFRTSANAMKSSLVGKTSVLKGMPIQVLTSAFQICNREAQDIKFNREHHTLLVPPRTTTRSS